MSQSHVARRMSHVCEHRLSRCSHTCDLQHTSWDCNILPVNIFSYTVHTLVTVTCDFLLIAYSFPCSIHICCTLKKSHVCEHFPWLSHAVCPMSHVTCLNSHVCEHRLCWPDRTLSLSSMWDDFQKSYLGFQVRHQSLQAQKNNVPVVSKVLCFCLDYRNNVRDIQLVWIFKVLE